VSQRAAARADARPVGWRARVRARERIGHLALHAALIGGSLLFLVPFFWLVSTSLKLTGRELVMPPQWIPDPLVLDNYQKAVTRLPFPLYLRNTLIVTLTATFFGVLTASLAGFGFARLRFPGRGLLFSLCLAALMIPTIVTLIPEFLVFKQLGLIDTFWPLVLPPSLGGGAFAVFLFRQYALTIPNDLDEAARVDGADAFRIWWSVILPLSKPVLATMAVLAFIQHWNDFLRPLVYLNSIEVRTLALGLRSFLGEFTTAWNLLMAASTLMILPILVLFFVAQRYFVQGIVMTGIKG
jgi:ABC-type glycerol-3-phosphate transport system permease component